GRDVPANQRQRLLRARREQSVVLVDEILDPGAERLADLCQARLFLAPTVQGFPCEFVSGTRCLVFQSQLFDGPLLVADVRLDLFGIELSALLLEERADAAADFLQLK